MAPSGQPINAAHLVSAGVPFQTVEPTGSRVRPWCGSTPHDEQALAVPTKRAPILSGGGPIDDKRDWRRKGSGRALGSRKWHSPPHRIALHTDVRVLSADTRQLHQSFMFSQRVRSLLAQPFQYLVDSQVGRDLGDALDPLGGHFPQRVLGEGSLLLLPERVVPSRLPVGTGNAGAVVVDH